MPRLPVRPAHPPRSVRSRDVRAASPLRAAGVLAAGALVVGLAAGQPVAARASTPDPGSSAALTPSASAPASGPGAPTPAAPTVVGVERFEEGDLGTPVFLEDYVGVDGARYTAHVDWLDPTRCNGIVTRFAAPDQQHCAAVSPKGAVQQRALAHGLGQLHGAADPARNHAVASRTASRPVRAGEVQLESVGSLATGVDGRFLTAGVDVGVMACSSARPSLTFALTRGTAELPVSSTAVDPCVGDVATFRAPDGTDVVAGRHLGERAVLAGQGVYGAQVRNHQSADSGNDLALDDLAVFDVTPDLTMAFRDAEIVVGDATELVYTVTNTTELGEKRGWSFDQALPAGLRVAADVAGSCDVTTSSTSTGLHLVGGLAVGDASCTVVVPVVADAEGRYDVTGADVSGLRGLDGPGRASLVVVPQAPAAIDVTVVPRANGTALGTTGHVSVDDVVDYAATVTNTGGREVNGLVVEHVVEGHGPAALFCDATTLAVGASTLCALPVGAAWVVDQDDFDTGLVTGAAEIRAASSSGELSRTVPTRVVAADASPAFTVDGTAAFVELDGRVGAGPDDAVDVALDLVNTGNVSLDLGDVFVPPTGLEPSPLSTVASVCDDAVIRPGGSTTCRTQTPFGGGRIIDLDKGVDYFSDVRVKPRRGADEVDQSVRLKVKGLPEALNGSKARPQPGTAPDPIAERARRLAYTGLDGGAALVLGAGLLVLGGSTVGIVTAVRRRRSS